MKGAVGRKKISLAWEVLSLKACGMSRMRCPVRWVGEKKSFPGRAKGEKKVNIKDEIEEAGSLEEIREKQREK